MPVEDATPDRGRPSPIPRRIDTRHRAERGGWAGRVLATERSRRCRLLRGQLRAFDARGDRASPWREPRLRPLRVTSAAGTGIGASNQFEASGFIRSSTDFAWPNPQHHFLPLAISYNGSNPVEAHGFQAHVGSMRSPSRGRVRLKTRDSRAHPSILFNYMSCEQDWQEFREGIRIMREIMAQPVLAPYRGREISPGTDPRSDAELDAFVRARAGTAYHPSCSCRMGTDAMPVVDGQGRVHGLEGLRVVDASIMPLIVTGNLDAPTVMIAEKIADRIRGRAPLPRADVPYFVAGAAPTHRPPARPEGPPGRRCVRRQL